MPPEMHNGPDLNTDADAVAALTKLAKSGRIAWPQAYEGEPKPWLDAALWLEQLIRRGIRVWRVSRRKFRARRQNPRKWYPVVEQGPTPLVAAARAYLAKEGE